MKDLSRIIQANAPSHSAIQKERLRGDSDFF
jgi:hypothetical protein